MQAVLVAREIQQVVDQLHQPLHLFVHRVQQVGFTGLRVKACALQKQAKRHVHARDRGAQLMRGAQHELTAHALKGPLFGHIVQHHHRPKDRPLGLADRRQAVRQQAGFAFDVDAQVFRRALEAAAAQDRQQLLVEFRAAQCLAQRLAQARLVPP